MQAAMIPEISEPIVRFEEDMSPHTTLGIGGKTPIYIQIEDIEQAREAMEIFKSNGLPFRIIGLGSNLLVSDERLQYGILCFKTGRKGIKFLENEVICSTGVPLPYLAMECVKRGLSGLEGLAGVPGSVGGALVMNAGAFGSEILNFVKWVKILSENGESIILAKDISFGYRTSNLKGKGMIVEVSFSFEHNDPISLKAKMEEAKKKREATQPIRGKTAGSVFKNPPGAYAGKILEDLGVKGKRRGNVSFSHKHANFMINEGGGRFSDALELIKEARENALMIGYNLELEMEVFSNETP